MAWLAERCLNDGREITWTRTWTWTWTWSRHKDDLIISLTQAKLISGVRGNDNIIERTGTHITYHFMQTET